MLIFYEYTNTNTRLSICICKTNSDLLFDSYMNQIAKSTIRPSLIFSDQKAVSTSKQVYCECLRLDRKSFANLGIIIKVQESQKNEITLDS